jgi:2,3-bisphosphoglycerate-independent phosphoglycerate mutase
MKYFVMLGDGMADRPLECLGGKTPLEVADIPNMHQIAKIGQTGLVQTVPCGFSPGSDVANLSVLGYCPKKFYSGRSSLEALSIGVNMLDDEIAYRVNLVTVENGIMLDYSAGDISSEEAKQLIEALRETPYFSKPSSQIEVKFYTGVAYRHCMVLSGGGLNTTLTPPHDITGKAIDGYMPKGDHQKEFCEMILKSAEVFKNHPVNLNRIAKGQKPATHIWFWGLSTKPKLEDFAKRYGLKGAIISAVDLLKGIAKGANMLAPFVEGATGTLNSNFVGKTNKVIECFKNGYDYVYLHIEAPDEEGHKGNTQGKIKGIQEVDAALKRVWNYLKTCGDNYVIALLPDHATPIEIKTHCSKPVPYAIYKSQAPFNSGLSYTENQAEKGIFLASGEDIIKEMIRGIENEE